MRAHHLKKNGDIWYFQRRTPKSFEDVERRSLIRFSLKTHDFSEARLLAAQASLELEQEWKEAKRRGKSLKSECDIERHEAAKESSQRFGFVHQTSSNFSDEELLARLRLLIEKSPAPDEQKAVLGLIDAPVISLTMAFDRFWDHIRDERLSLGADQQRVKRNIFLRAIRKFEAVVGQVSSNSITRQHALTYRDWCIKQVEKQGTKPASLNKEIGALRRIVATNDEIDGIDRINPFQKVKLKDIKQIQRKPFSSAFIQTGLLANSHLDGLPEELALLVKILVNTGCRPSEIIGLELDDIDLAGDTPFIHIRRNKTRSLKTDHSERQIPLVGVSYQAALDLASMKGWGKWQGKNMYATSVINKYFREQKIVTDPNQSLYSLRHWFQDQLTKHDVIDRAQAQLMGHKFQRPKYGYGKDLEELNAIIKKFAIH